MARMGRSLVDSWNSCVSAIRGSYVDPAVEAPTTQNCWSWSWKRWFISGKGELVVSISPRERVLRCCWAPEGDKGPMWHFEPIHPQRGLKAIWHSYLHLGQPKDLRNVTD